MSERGRNFSEGRGVRGPLSAVSGSVTTPLVSVSTQRGSGPLVLWLFLVGFSTFPFSCAIEMKNAGFHFGENKTVPKCEGGQLTCLLGQRVEGHAVPCLPTSLACSPLNRCGKTSWTASSLS